MNDLGNLYAKCSLKSSINLGKMIKWESHQTLLEPGPSSWSRVRKNCQKRNEVLSVFGEVRWRCYAVGCGGLGSFYVPAVQLKVPLGKLRLGKNIAKNAPGKPPIPLEVCIDLGTHHETWAFSVIHSQNSTPLKEKLPEPSSLAWCKFQLDILKCPPMLLINTARFLTKLYPQWSRSVSLDIHTQFFDWISVQQRPMDVFPPWMIHRRHCKEVKEDGFWRDSSGNFWDTQNITKYERRLWRDV